MKAEGRRVAAVVVSLVNKIKRLASPIDCPEWADSCRSLATPVGPVSARSGYSSAANV